MSKVQVVNQLKYIKPQSCSFGSIPRITQEEWNQGLDRGWLGDDWDKFEVTLYEGRKVFYYPGFTLYQDMVVYDHEEVDCGSLGIQSFDNYREVIDIFLPYKQCKHKKCSRHQVFGPHKSQTLAREKAVKFLVEHNLICLVDK